MIFEWDENKNRINRARHRISFEVAATVFNDAHCASRIDKKEHYEERWQTIGYTNNELILLVVHTYQADNDIIIRIISARKAEKHEKEQYKNGTF